MKVRAKRYFGDYGPTVDKDLESLFTPEPEPYSYGESNVDYLKAKVNESLESIGRLIAKLHEKGILTFAEACEVSGNSWEKLE